MFNKKVISTITSIFSIASFIYIFFGSDNPSYGRLASLVFLAFICFASFYYGFIKPRWLERMNDLNNSFNSVISDLNESFNDAIKENQNLLKADIDKINKSLEYIKIKDKTHIYSTLNALYDAVNKIEEEIGLQKTDIDIFKQKYRL